jgi:hypothetical protein
MIAAASPGPVLVAAIMRARRKIADHFFFHRAVTAEDAVAFVPERQIMRRQFDHMRSKGLIREAAPGRYWIDVAAYRADGEARRRRLVPIVIVLALIAAAIPLFFY